VYTTWTLYTPDQRKKDIKWFNVLTIGIIDHISNTFNTDQLHTYIVYSVVPYT